MAQNKNFAQIFCRLTILVSVAFASQMALAGPAVKLLLSLPNGDKNFVAGVAKPVSVTAVDANGEVDLNYNGTVRFHGSTPSAVIATGTLVQGQGVVSVEFRQAVWSSMKIVDTRNLNLFGIINMLKVAPGPLSTFAPTTSSLRELTAGSEVEIAVKAQDQFGNVLVSYSGALIAKTSDPKTTPTTLALIAGQGKVSLKLLTAGAHSITIADPAIPEVVSTLDGFVISPGNATEVKFVAQPTNAKVGQPFTEVPALRAFDAYGNFIKRSDLSMRLKLATNANGAALVGEGVVDGSALVTSADGEFTFRGLSVNKAVPGAKLSAELLPSQLGALSQPFDIVSDIKGTIYYVSNLGNDANDGKSPEKAWATVAKVNAAKYVAGDGVLFRGGDQFSGCLLFNAKNVPNTTADAGITISAYGQGKFQLNATCTGSQPDGNGVAAIQITQLSGVTVSNAILRGAQGKSDGTWYGVFLYNPYQPAGVMRNIKILDNDIGGFYTIQPRKYGGQIFWNTYYQTKTSIDHLLISGNKLHGLNGPSSPDNNGIMGIAQLPVISHVTIEKNVIYDIGGKAGGLPGVEGNGIVGIGLNGAVIRHNVAHDLGGNANTCGGPGGIWLVQANNAVIEKNEVYRVRPLTTPPAGACDWIGYDMDYSVTNSFIQYNYSHDNWGAGLLFFGKYNWGPNVARYNVSINDGLASNGRASTTASVQIGGESGTKMLLSIYNNTIIGAEGANPAGTNLAFNLNSTTVIPTGHVMNNLFFHNAHAPGSSVSTIISTSGSNNAAGFLFKSNTYFNSLPFAGAMADRTNVRMKTAGTLANWLLNGVDRDSLASLADPMLEQAPTVAPTCFNGDQGITREGELAACLQGKMPSLQRASPNRGAGLNLSSAPYNFDLGGTLTTFDGTETYVPRDFFGNLLNTGAGANIGADGF